ncbi:MAG: trypsin-like peptidase domain-containing protein [Verrucomicrobia bacterium]|nr:trypsin-like peptidase domain-containing protein [Verrucomicrobiota bacterium]
MLKLVSVVLTLGCLGARAASADFIQLKDQAAVTGTILAEKKDQVVVDLGFTVLAVPRSEIVKITKAAGADAAAKAASRSARTRPPTKTAPLQEFFTAATGSSPERSVRDWANDLGEAVVQVRTPAGLGSGFFLNEDGYLISNFHVVEGEMKISVEVYHRRGGQLDRKTYKDVRIVALNKFHDLALLRVEDPGAPKFNGVPLGDPDRLSVGERVFAIGSPLGLERTVTEGILSSKTREMQGNLYLQTTAQINPGNSGGPLFNLRGEVIGVINMKLTFGEGIGFAIPADLVKHFLKNRDAFAYDNENPASAYRYLAPPSRVNKLREPNDP